MKLNKYIFADVYKRQPATFPCREDSGFIAGLLANSSPLILVIEPVNVTLKEDSQVLAETVVIGYGLSLIHICKYIFIQFHIMIVLKIKVVFRMENWQWHLVTSMLG